MIKELKLKVIYGKFLIAPEPQQVLDFVNNEDIEIVSILGGLGRGYQIFYYEIKKRVKKK